MNLLTISLILVGASYVSYGAVTEQEKEEILDIHNRLRRQVAKGQNMEETRLPRAANMRKLVWNEDLAEKAQIRADKCIYAHDTFDERKIAKFPKVGQNIYRKWKSSSQVTPEPVVLNMTRGVQAWFNEYVDYTFGTQSGTAKCNPEKKCGHLTQVVWGDTYEIGCGKKHCTSESDGVFKSTSLLFCNYGPTGNYRGQFPYTEGDACTKCRSGDKCEDSLCVPTADSHKPNNQVSLKNCIRSCLPPGVTKWPTCKLTQASQNQGSQSTTPDNFQICLQKCTVPPGHSLHCTLAPVEK